LPPIALNILAGPLHILLLNGIIDAELLAQPLAKFRRHARIIRKTGERIARGECKDREHPDADQNEGNHRHKRSANHKSSHVESPGQRLNLSQGGASYALGELFVPARVVGSSKNIILLTSRQEALLVSAPMLGVPAYGCQEIVHLP